ncbi:MAG: hypothetical protein ABI227_00275 [Rhodanobacter sp.]
MLIMSFRWISLKTPWYRATIDPVRRLPAFHLSRTGGEPSHERNALLRTLLSGLLVIPADRLATRGHVDNDAAAH